MKHLSNTSLEDYQKNVVCENPKLAEIFKNAVIQFEKPND
jgi:hypothetical protein